MSQENVTSLRHGFELWNVASSAADEKIWRAALAEMVAGYHSDAEVDFSRTLPDFPNAGVVEAMSGWVEAARGMFTDVRLEPTAIIDAGDAAVATMRVTGTGGLSGATVDAEIFYVFRFRDGLVSAATTYMTEQEALEAVGLEK